MRSEWTILKARKRSCGTGTSHECSAQRLRVQVRTALAFEIKVLTTEYEAVMDVALDVQHSLASSGVTEVLVSLPHMWYRNRNLLAWENSKS